MLRMQRNWNPPSLLVTVNEGSFLEINSLAVSQSQTEIPLLVISLKELEKKTDVNSNSNLSMMTHISTVHSGQKMKIQMFIIDN